VRLGITPPVAPVLAPHLIGLFAAEAPQVTVEVQRMWLPSLTDALICGRIDMAITCGLIPAPEGTVNEVFCGEPLMVGLRPDHRLASRDKVALPDLAYDALGTTSRDLFPAWTLSERQVAGPTTCPSSVLAQRLGAPALGELVLADDALGVDPR
jgi:DNA-binding transcriptional LysR family regulator